MDANNTLFSQLSTVLWGWPMIILLLGTHVFLTFRLDGREQYSGPS